MIYNGTPYYYLKNAQGDVASIVDANMNVVGSYTYDAWGKILSVTGSIAQINPIRYRSYYYDKETNLYYLQSRYYDPETGRFLNADDTDILDADPENMVQYNLFAYGFNNPVSMTDDSGSWPSWATKLLIGTAVIAAAAILTVATAGTGTALACFAAGALKGAVVGAAVGAVSGAATGAVSHRIKTGSWRGAGKAALNGAADGYMSGAITGFISGGLTSHACFVAGTPVLSSVGLVAIETVQEGDSVWAEDPETGEKALKTVVRTFVNESDELIHVHTGDDEIVCTPEHPFYVPAKGWTGAAQLRAGDILVLSNGSYVTVEKIQHEILESPVKVYNFEVEDFHTYFVGENSVLVHNLCHANSLKTSKKTELYVLKDQDSGAVRKIGETTRGVRRYTRRYYESNNVYMRVLDSGSKRAMHYQQHRLLKTYVSKMGRLPDLNRSLW